MRKTMISKCLVVLVSWLLAASIVCAQEDKSKRLSPPATATGHVMESAITINYSSPAVKGRKIWGALVPYDQVWRAGANEATTFENDKDISVEGKMLPAGKYTLYTVPGEKEWVIIFSSQTGQWGINRDHTTTRDPANDILRVNVIPRKTPGLIERLKYTVDSSGFALEWENLEVPVSIK